MKWAVERSAEEHAPRATVSARRGARGQVGVIIAMAMTTLLGAAALSVDVGDVYLNWEHLQQAADAAAMAGASYLPYDSADAQTNAVNYATSNGVKKSEVSSTQVAADELSITVKLNRTVPLYFARALGMKNAPISAQATAGVLQDANGGRGLLPLALPCAPGACTYTKGTLYQLKAGPLAPGNFGALALGGNGANTYRQNIETGYVGTLNIGDYVSTEPGNVVGPTTQGITDRVNLGLQTDPSGTYTTAPAYDPRVVVLPMANYTSVNGKYQVQVVGLALMWISSISGDNATVNAYYLGPATDNPSQQTPNKFGALPPILLQ